jgi:hypothetical protein
MSRDLLGLISRSLICVPEEHHDVILDVVTKLSGANVAATRQRIAFALGGEPLPPPAPLDTIVRVNRAVRPFRPRWLIKVMEPELDAMGPSEYDLSTIQLSQHDNHISGRTKGQEIYDFLKKENLIEGCLGLVDGYAIQEKGLDTFNRFFRSHIVYLWKSVTEDRDGALHVPLLDGLTGGVSGRANMLVGFRECYARLLKPFA